MVNHDFECITRAAVIAEPRASRLGEAAHTRIQQWYRGVRCSNVRAELRSSTFAMAAQRPRPWRLRVSEIDERRVSDVGWHDAELRSTRQSARLPLS